MERLVLSALLLSRLTDVEHASSQSAWFGVTIVCFSVIARRAIAVVISAMSAESASASLNNTANDGCVWPSSSRATNERWTSARCANSSWLMFSCVRLALISAATALTTASSCVFLMPRNAAMGAHLCTCIYGTKWPPADHGGRINQKTSWQSNHSRPAIGSRSLG